MGATNTVYALPSGFVYLSDIAPGIIQDIKYATNDNFVGRPIKAYAAPTCILKYNTAIVLAKLQKQLKRQSLGLKVYDCYRPTDAVADFIQWSHDIQDQQQKQHFYPHINKADFFKLGYVAEKSGHSRGDTVDLTLVNLRNGLPLNMGTAFDYMDVTSHPLDNTITKQAKYNRMYLRKIMLKAGFMPLETEWWHFTYKDDSVSHIYFNFPVR